MTRGSEPHTEDGAHDSPANHPDERGKSPSDLRATATVEDSDRKTELSQLHRLLIANVRDYAIFALDPSGVIVSWNDGARHIKGYTAEDIIGKHFSIFYPQEDLDAGKPAYELEVASYEGRFEDEGWRLRKDGTRFWANVIITALRDSTGELVGFGKVTRDLTERRAAQERLIADARRIAAAEAEREAAELRAGELSDLLDRLRDKSRELEQQRREAEIANRAKSDFLAAMSHELRTPLNAIAGYVELLEMGLHGPITEEQRRDLDRILHNQQHLLGIINDILNFSRIEAGQLTYEIRPINIRETLDLVTPMIAMQAESNGLIFERDGAPDALALADPSKVEQILLNLLSNAVKFTDEGGRVSLAGAVVGDQVHIQVSDTGCGIPADKLDVVFEPFVQIGRSLTRASEGTGLGLAISRDLALAMGGELRVESEEGVGTTFTLELPRA